jgi:L-lactate dehydrogenase (cytochrome)
VLVSLDDFAAASRSVLPRQLYNYIKGGAFREITLKANTEDFNLLRLRQSILRDVSQIDTSASLFGQTLGLPLVLAPIGLGGMVATRGEAKAFRAVAKKGVAMCLSTMSVCSAAETAGAANGNLWFQLYMMRDRGAVKELMARARAAGVSKLVVTVDLPVAGIRYSEMRNSRFGAIGLRAKLRTYAGVLNRPRWALTAGLAGRPHTFGNLDGIAPDSRILGDFWPWAAQNFDASVTWRDLAWLSAQWDGDVVVKGILTPDDAQHAMDHGAQGIVVSNHGGRQLDGVPSTIRSLPDVAAKVGERIPIILDGGIRSGLDLLKALSLGASAVMVGRPWVYALALEGERGVSRMIDILEHELRTGMALVGCTRVSELNHQTVMTA